MTHANDSPLVIVRGRHPRLPLVIMPTRDADEALSDTLDGTTYTLVTCTKGIRRDAQAVRFAIRARCKPICDYLGASLLFNGVSRLM